MPVWCDEVLSFNQLCTCHRINPVTMISQQFSRNRHMNCGQYIHGMPHMPDQIIHHPNERPRDPSLERQRLSVKNHIIHLTDEVYCNFPGALSLVYVLLCSVLKKSVVSALFHSWTSKDDGQHIAPTTNDQSNETHSF